MPPKCAIGCENRADPVSRNSSNPKYSQSRTDTRIGSRVRVEGDVTFVGVMHVDGVILGDVSCGEDASGMIVIDQAGNVSGTVRAPHIVVAGSVSGPSYSTQTLEIQTGASLVGDTFYREIEVRPGGIIEGSLTPDLSSGPGELLPEQMRRGPTEFEERHIVGGSDGEPIRGRYRRLALGAGGVIALVVLGVAFYLNREPAPAVVPSPELSSNTEPQFDKTSRPPTIRSEPAGTELARAVSGTDANQDNQVADASLRAVDSSEVVVVQGVNPAKPAGALALVSEGPSVLFRKKREDSSAGVRVDIPRGASTLAIGKNEVIRVAEGSKIVIFYQGRKVGPKTIDSGTWMSFVPQTEVGGNPEHARRER